MKALAIDTSTQRAIVVLFDEQALVGFKALEFGYDHAKHLLEYMQALFSELQISPEELAYVAVGRGPGSYTGIRVGVSCAKALSLALDIPLVGLSSLRGFVPPVDYEGSFIAAIDAKIGGVYLIEGSVVNKKISYLSDEKLVPFTDFIEILLKTAKTCCLVTPFYEPMKKRLDEANVAIDIQVVECHPSPLQLMHEAKKLFYQNAYRRDASLELLYLR